MIDFQKIDLNRREDYTPFLFTARRGCEYSFANTCLWGRQRAAFVADFLVLFSQFDRRSVYPFPVGSGDIRPVLDAIIQDARERGIVCCLTGLSADQCMLLEELYPGQFRFHPDRNSCDYVYRIEDLAQLKGRKYQKKRNHVNKFRTNHPHCRAVPLDSSNLEAAQEMVAQWYQLRHSDDPSADFHLEQQAISRAFRHMDALGIEGLVLEEDGNILAVAMGSRLSEDTFDIHFEKAREDADGAYAAINQAFAAHLMAKYPDLHYLDREEDMGLEGLRKAKLSYYPHHLVVKFWARLWEETDDD